MKKSVTEKMVEVEGLEPTKPEGGAFTAPVGQDRGVEQVTLPRVQCDVGGCQILKRTDTLACDWHWKMLPKLLRNDVVRTFWKVANDPREVAAVRLCVAWWRENDGRVKSPLFGDRPLATDAPTGGGP